MILDDQLYFASAADCSGAAGKALIGTGKDLEGSQFRVGSSHKAMLMITVTTAFAGAGTVGFELATDATATIANDGSANSLMQIGPVSVANLALGKRYGIPLPSGTQTNEGFMGVLVARSATISAGAVNAFIVLDAQDWEPFPEGVN